MKHILTAIILSISVIMVTGYVLNIYKLVICDFEPSYKEEVIRIISIPTGLGGIVGYINFEKESK